MSVGEALRRPLVELARSGQLRASDVIMLIKGLDIRIIHATTGPTIRALILNPDVDYQARGIRKPRKNPT